MSDRPILFSAPMVRALLDGRKTQTRRLAWRGCKRCDGRGYHISEWNQDCIPCPACEVEGQRPTVWQSVKPGDRIYVKENWRTELRYDWIKPRDIPQGATVYYEAGDVEATPECAGKLRPSIFLPRRYSRLTLVVTATKMERLEDISYGDAIAEGIDIQDFVHPITTFFGLWNSLHTKPGARLEDNPECVALTFEVHQQNINAMEAE